MGASDHDGSGLGLVVGTGVGNGLYIVGSGVGFVGATVGAAVGGTPMISSALSVTIPEYSTCKLCLQPLPIHTCQSALSLKPVWLRERGEERRGEEERRERGG